MGRDFNFESLLEAIQKHLFKVDGRAKENFWHTKKLSLKFKIIGQLFIDCFPMKLLFFPNSQFDLIYF